MDFAKAINSCEMKKGLINFLHVIIQNECS